MASPLDRCREFVRQTFDAARDDLEHDIRVIIAQQTLTSLESGQTVKRIVDAFEQAAADAAATCRASAERSRPMREYLPTVLFVEVDRLADQAAAALTRINLMDDHARQRLAKHRDRALIDRTPPADPPSKWSRVKAVIGSTPREVVNGLILAGALGLIATMVTMCSAPPG